jgi:hypothetical protein
MTTTKIANASMAITMEEATVSQDAIFNLDEFNTKGLQ